MKINTVSTIYKPKLLFLLKNFMTLSVFDNMLTVPISEHWLHSRYTPSVNLQSYSRENKDTTTWSSEITKKCLFGPTALPIAYYVLDKIYFPRNSH